MGHVGDIDGVAAILVEADRFGQRRRLLQFGVGQRRGLPLAGSSLLFSTTATANRLTTPDRARPCALMVLSSS